MNPNTSLLFQASPSKRRSPGAAEMTGGAFMPHMRRADDCHSVM